MSALASNPFSLESKRILVTGATSGIGKACCVQIATMGGKVVAVGRDEGGLAETIQSLSGQGHESVIMDLNEYESLPQKMLELGPLNGLVHSAGIQVTQPIQQLDFAKCREMLDVNVFATLALAKGFRHRKVCVPGSSLVFISSVMANVSSPGMAGYSASKSAVNGLVRALAIEFSRDKHRVNCIAPSLVQTRMWNQMKERMDESQIDTLQSLHPLGIGSPEDVAHAVTFLISDAAKWITGTCLVIDGGYSAQ